MTKKQKKMPPRPERVAMAPITLIFGKRGAGKTFLLKKLTRSKKKILFIDPVGEFRGAKDGEIIEGVDELIQFFQDKRNKLFRAYYQIGKAQEIDYIARVAWAVKNMTLAIDEIDMFAPIHGMNDYMATLIKRGRHRGISLYGTSRRPPEVSKLLTSQANRIVVFNTHEPRDIAYLGSFMGKKAEEAIKLSNHDYIDWNG